MKKINKKELKRIIQEEIKDLGFFKRMLGFKSDDAKAILDAVDEAVKASYGIKVGDAETYQAAIETITKLVEDAEAAGIRDLPDRNQSLQASWALEAATRRIDKMKESFDQWGLETEPTAEQQPEPESSRYKLEPSRSPSPSRGRDMSAKDIGYATPMTREAPPSNPLAGVGLSRQKDWELRWENKRKLTKSKLQRIINEEIKNVIREIG